MGKTILKVENLHVSFETRSGSVKALRGVDFSLEKGKTLAIVGESGSGKSVTARAIMGFHTRNEQINGNITYRCENDGVTENYSILTMKKKDIVKQLCGKHIAMVFQDPMTVLNPTMTIGNQIAEAVMQNGKIKKKDALIKAKQLLEEVGITDAELRLRHYPHQLSGGMRQRVVIAIALSCEPQILICDEPTTALDVTIQAKILELIQSIQKKRNIAVIYITHDLGVVAKVADEVAVMYAGKIIEKGSVNEIFYNARHPYTWSLLRSVPDIKGSENRLYSIPGAPPRLMEDIEGDAFAARNPQALAIDYRKEPPRFDLSDTHYVYSWLEDKRAPKLSFAAV